MTDTPELPAVPPLLDELAGRLRAELADDTANSMLIGIHTGGVWLAEALHERLGLALPLGTLDVSYYRDDLARGGLHPRLQPSNLPGSVDGKTVWLVDDVLQTGRTVRAALNEIFDFGRPARVRLIALIDRDGRELPIAADLVGAHLELPSDLRVHLQGPDPLHLALGEGRARREEDAR
ncbi:bifunctional pyr operon transcriptional regulator/uracil phosphoribosyltransferase PyrR [Acidihalobacter prosperus]